MIGTIINYFNIILKLFNIESGPRFVWQCRRTRWFAPVVALFNLHLSCFEQTRAARASDTAIRVAGRQGVPATHQDSRLMSMSRMGWMTSAEFAEAYTRGYRNTVRFLVAAGVPAGLADDAAQAGWTRGWERLDQLKAPQSILPWVNRISLNMFCSTLRSERPTAELTDMPSRALTGPATLDVRRCLDRQSRDDRNLLLAYYLEGRSSHELGRRYGCSPGAVRVRALRAKRRFIGTLAL